MTCHRARSSPVSSAQAPCCPTRVGGDQSEGESGQGMCLSRIFPPSFTLQGLDEELQQEGMLLGQFTYDQDGEPIQTFHFQVEDGCASRGSILISHPFSRRFLSSDPVPGTRGLEQETAAPALRQLTVWGRQLSEVAQADTSTGEGPFQIGRWGRLLGRTGV